MTIMTCDKLCRNQAHQEINSPVSQSSTYSYTAKTNDVIEVTVLKLIHKTYQ